ncbi:MAG: DoxX family protein [Bacteroidales bacterium]|jgi:uncharacterized membrane protein YphA (DoxX/SURF4 family)|nr:DoxX family protein [Bacteroidales bacterium]
MKTVISPKFRYALILIAQLILGATFVFSGFVKGDDPYGFVYKIQDYLEAFGLYSLATVAFPAAFSLIVLEFLLGINILLGMHVKITGILLLIFLGIMTPLTLYLALANPVEDCGCFGDALIITNWQTFGKNIVLSGLAIFIFIYRKEVKSPFSDKMQWLATLSSAVYILGTGIIGVLFSPVFDFRPYKVGVSIPEAMTLPEGAAIDEYESSYVYAKNGEEKVFSRLEDVPADDDTWTFVATNRKLIKKGDQPTIHDFVITDIETGDDITEKILTLPDFSFMLISRNLAEANIDHIEKINDVHDFCTSYGYGFYCLTSSTPEQIAQWKRRTAAEYPFCTMDETTLKTILRSNPGLMLIKNGVIYDKWHYNEFPSDAELSQALDASPLGSINYPDNRFRVMTVSLSFVMLLLTVFGLDKLALLIQRWKRKH